MGHLNSPSYFLPECSTKLWTLKFPSQLQLLQSQWVSIFDRYFVFYHTCNIDTCFTVPVLSRSIESPWLSKRLRPFLDGKEASRFLSKSFCTDRNIVKFIWDVQIKLLVLFPCPFTFCEGNQPTEPKLKFHLMFLRYQPFSRWFRNWPPCSQRTSKALLKLLFLLSRLVQHRTSMNPFFPITIRPSIGVSHVTDYSCDYTWSEPPKSLFVLPVMCSKN